MGRRTWLTLALVTIVVAGTAVGLAVASPKRASNPRPKTITRGLDFLHSRQQTNGGFGTMANTAWGILGAVASGERLGSKLWTIGGKNPYAYLQAGSHTAAAGSDPSAPVYYARAIMAYVAAGHLEMIFQAGTPPVDLLEKLYSYQDFVDGSPTKGRFSPLSSIPTRQAVDATAWAILGMQALGGNDQARFAPAVSWLAGQQTGDGGFPADQGSTISNVRDTALSIQALVAGGTPVNSPAIQNARQYLKNNQRPDGGFSYAEHGSQTDGSSTAAAIQAIVAVGEDPGAWKYGSTSNTPLSALAGLQLKTGAYHDKAGDSSAPVALTSWALVALREKSFATYPRSPGGKYPGFVYRPQIRSAQPADHAEFTGAHTVLIQAKYTDGSKPGRVGTGVSAKACRVYVDNVNRTSHAKIGSSSLHLQLQNVPNGPHTYRLRIVDYAGNAKELVRTFTMAVPTPTPTVVPTYTPPYVPPSSTPTPSTTLYPTPAASGSGTPYPGTSTSPYPGTVSGAPIPTPSPSGSAPAKPVGGGSVGGFVGGTLLALLPIGAAASYLVINRRERALDPAAEGQVLPGGGSPWDRVKSRVRSLKDLVKPAGR